MDGLWAIDGLIVGISCSSYVQAVALRCVCCCRVFCVPVRVLTHCISSLSLLQCSKSDKLSLGDVFSIVMAVVILGMQHVLWM